MRSYSRAEGDEPFISHVTPADGNIFADLGSPPEEAENLIVRAELMLQLTRLIESRRLTQAKAAKLFGATQPRISDLVRGKIDKFSVDMLISMLGRAGMSVRVTVRPTAA